MVPEGVVVPEGGMVAIRTMELQGVVVVEVVVALEGVMIVEDVVPKGVE